MRKQALLLDWQVANDEEDWAHLSTLAMLDVAPSATLVADGRRSSRRFLGGVVAILLLLVSAGDWWWRMAQAEAQQQEAEPSTPAQQEVSVVAHRPDLLVASEPDNQSDAGWRLQHGREVSGLRTAIQTASQTEEPAAHVDIALHSVEFQGDQAVVSIVMTAKNGAPAYRQTRFYQRTSTGWLWAEPNTILWGPERSLETPFFLFHFRQHDAQAVIAVAPQIEDLYTTLRRNFGLPVSPTGLPSLFAGEKLVIDVSVTQSPGNTAFQPHNYERFVMDDRLIVASPAVYLAPVELTDADLLAQSIALPLLEQVLAQANARYQIRAAWQPLLGGLYLWQVWDLDLPLSAWRDDVVQWIYGGLPASRPGQAVVLPERYTALCAAHRLWLPAPAQLEIPLICTELDRKDWVSLFGGHHDPLIHLDQFSVPVPKPLTRPSFPENHPGQAVALATLIEYAVATYGRERLPVLVAGLGQYESWDTLLPAVYGVSATEFEAGWQAYLTAHCGIGQYAVRCACVPRCH